MPKIADIDGIEQPDGSFLQRRTHTPDPLLRIAMSRTVRRVSEYSSRSLGDFVGASWLHALPHGRFPGVDACATCAVTTARPFGTEKSSESLCATSHTA
jgi:hypothetical protein